MPSTTISYASVGIPVLVEFTAQFIHTFWGVMCSTPLTNNRNLTYYNDEADYTETVFLPAFQSGISVVLNILVFCKLSVAHFNPAVTLGFFVAGQIGVVLSLLYVVAQCIASVLAAWLAKLILGETPAAIIVGDDIPTASIFFNELIITGVLMFFCVATVVDDNYDQPLGALAVGLTVFQGVLSGKWVGVACLSPSRAFGPAVIAGGAAWNRHWLLWVSDLTGAFVFSALYMIFFAPEEKSWRSKIFRSSSSKSDVKKENGVAEEVELMDKNDA